MKKIRGILLMICAFIICLPYTKAGAAVPKKYGIVIANQRGYYTFYDMNATDGSAGIALFWNKTVMISLKQVVEKIEGLRYRYYPSRKQAVVTNTSNGNRVTYSPDSKYCYCCFGAKKIGVKRAMVCKAYESTTSSQLMVHMSALKYLFSSTNGFRYYNKTYMQNAGYDTMQYNGLIVYNAFRKVDSIPIASTVTGIANTVRVTIPEGYSLPQAFALIAGKGACASKASLYDAMNHFDYSKYPLVSATPAQNSRCFKLEGYLYPDTYEFYRLSKPQDIIRKILKNGESRITQQDRNKAESLGYSMDEILTIASLIEKETGKADVMPDVSAVIHNRLKQKMKLQLDASIFYVERYIKPNIDGDVNRFNSYYNTYKCSALPAGPVCNPGRNAINAALNPSQTDYLYFISDADGQYHFSKELMTNQTQTQNKDGNTNQ